MKSDLPAQWLPVHKPLRVQLYFAHLLLLLLSLPFDRMYSHLILISFFLQWLLGEKTKWRERDIPWKKIALPAAIFFCTGFSLLYSPMKTEGGKEWLLQVPLLVMPLIMFALSPLLKQYRNSLLTVFSLVSLLTVFYLFGNALWTMHHFSLPATDLFSYAFTNHNFSEPVKMHATYLSMQWMLAMVFLIHQGWQAQSRRRRLLYYIAALVVLAGLLQLCSKSVGAAILCTGFIAWPLMIRKHTRRRLAIVVSVAAIALAAGVIAQSPAFRERYLSALREDFIRPAAGELAEPRVARWITALEIARTALVLGQGAGTEKTLLHEQFYRKKYYNSFLNHLNAHSEYLSLFLKNGIIGLCVYVLVLGAGFRAAWKRRDLLYITFMFLIALVSLGENILDLDKGVWFYAVFFSFFIFFPESRPPAQPRGRLTRNYREERVVNKNAVTIAIAGNNS